MKINAANVYGLLSRSKKPPIVPPRPPIADTIYPHMVWDLGSGWIVGFSSLPLAPRSTTSGEDSGAGAVFGASGIGGSGYLPTMASAPSLTPATRRPQPLPKVDQVLRL